LLALFCSSGMSCHQPTPTTPKKPATKVEYFKDRFQDIAFPHGQIDLSTVKDTPEGVEFQTEDGTRWRIKMTKAGDKYTFGDPERIK
jgi:uncharacterized protein YqjF (DUF2071 family)